jgi:hypothetical protein
VTVRAYDLTLRDFFENRRTAYRTHSHRADGRSLVAKVVELEHYGIGFFAIDAGMRLEVALDQRVALCAPPTLRGFHLLKVPPAALTEISTEALAAPPLSSTSVVPIERSGRQNASTSTASPERCGVGHGCWFRIRVWRWRYDYIAHPHTDRGERHAKPLRDRAE